MPLSNKIKNCPKKIVVEPINIPEPILTIQATAAPLPKGKRGRPRKNQPDPPEPTTSDPPASFPVPVAKKARKPRAKKISSELLEQVPVKKGKAKQKVQVEVEVEPVITVKKSKKPRLTKSQKLAQEAEEEESEASEDASGSEESEEIDSDEELDRAIDRLAKIKALQSD